MEERRKEEHIEWRIGVSENERKERKKERKKGRKEGRSVVKEELG